MTKLRNLLRSKNLITIITVGADIFIALGQLDPAIKPLLLALVSGLGALCVAWEGVADIISRIKNTP